MALKSTTEETVQTHIVLTLRGVALCFLGHTHSLRGNLGPRMCFHDGTGNTPLNPELLCRKAWDVSTETTLHALQHGAHFSEAPLAGRDGACL